MSLWPVVIIALLQTDQVLPRFERLDNGPRVVIVEDHTLPLVSVQLWYRVGSAGDPPNQPGMCHVVRSILEHRDSAALKLRSAGLRFESRTERDACYFSSVLPPNFLEYVLDIEAARVQPLTLSAEMLEQARALAVREYAVEADDPNHVVMRHVLSAMFPDHPYEHPPELVAQSVKDLSPDEANDFLRRWFVAANATLFVIGDVSTVRVLDQVRQRFGKLQSTEPPPRTEPPRLKTETIRVSVSDADRIGMTIAWRTPPLGYFANAAIDVLMQRLCNPVDGPLYRRLAEINCEPPRWKRYAWRDDGLLVLSIDADDGVSRSHLYELTTTVDEELAKAAQGIPSEIEHNRARALAGRDALLRRARFGDRAKVLAAHEVIAGDLLLAQFGLSRAARVGVPDLQQAAAGLRNVRTVHLPRQVPVEKKPIKPHEPSKQLDNAAAPDLLKAHAANVPAVESPESHATISTHELGNGVKITVCAVPALEPTNVRTLLTSTESPRESLGVLTAVGSTLHSADQLRDYLSYHGLDLFPLLQEPRPGLESRGPATRVAQMIELQAELVRHPAREARRHLGMIRAVEVLVVGNVKPAEVIEAVEAVWADWQVPPGRMTSTTETPPGREKDGTRQQARINRLLSLDSAAAIADLLGRGVSNPWDPRDESMKP